MVIGMEGGGRSRVADGRYVEARFLGRRIMGRSGVVQLALQAGGLVWPMSAVRRGVGRGELLCGEGPLEVSGSGAGGVATVTQEVYRRLEPPIRAFPSQWEGVGNIHRLMVTDDDDGGGRRKEEIEVDAMAARIDEGGVSVRGRRERYAFVSWEGQQSFCVNVRTLKVIRIENDMEELTYELLGRGAAGGEDRRTEVLMTLVGPEKRKDAAAWLARLVVAGVVQVVQ